MTLFDIDPTDHSRDSAFLLALGLEFDSVEDTRVEAHIELGEDHLTPWGVVHGGVYASIAETIASVGASQAVRDRNQYAAGLHNGTDFLRASSGGRLTVTGEAIQQGRTQQLWLVTMVREDGKDIARAQVRLQNVPFATS